MYIIMSRINYRSVITETEIKNNSLYIKYIKENGTAGECPWWCIYSFAELPPDIVDEDGLPTAKHMLIVVILNRQNGKLKHFLKLIDPECFAYCKIIDGVVTRPDFKSVKSK